MSWTAITEDDVLSSLSEVEANAIRTKFLKEGQSDPLSVRIARVTASFRQSIRTCRNNKLDPDETTLPPGCIDHAISIIRHRVLTRFSTTEISEARLLEYRDARDYLKAIAKCEQAVEQPFVEESSPSPLPPVGVNQRRQTNDWRNQDGI